LVRTRLGDGSFESRVIETDKAALQQPRKTRK
jgi:hypothetical protein